MGIDAQYGIQRPNIQPGERVGAPSVREPRGCAFVRGQRGLCGEGCMMRERPGSCAAGGACDCVPCDFPAVLAIANANGAFGPLPLRNLPRKGAIFIVLY